MMFMTFPPWQRCADAAVATTHLGLFDAQRLEELGVLDGQLDHFLDLLDLLVQAADHLVGGVGHLLHHHQGHQRVHLVGQDLVQRVAVVAQRHAAVGGHLVGGGGVRNCTESIVNIK